MSTASRIARAIWALSARGTGWAPAGVMIVIDSDAHGPETLANMRYGVYTARRARLGPGHVANTRSWDDLQRLRKKR